VLVSGSVVRLGLPLAHIELEHRLVARPLHQVFHAVVVPPYRFFFLTHGKRIFNN
jgi:hypothetical protein